MSKPFRVLYLIGFILIALGVITIFNFNFGGK